MKETLYSIRYPEVWESESKELDGEQRPSKETLDAEFEKILDKVENKSVCIPIPERIKKAEDLIKQTVEIAEGLELNVDIERYDDRIDFRFYDAVGLYLGKLREFFGKMFLICDEVMMYPPRDGASSLPGFHWVVDFSYYTHRRLVAGKEIHNL